MSLFLKDRDNTISWSQLIDDLRKTKSYNKYCKSEDYYTIFKNIIVSLLLSKEIILLDEDFTDTELKNLIGETDLSLYNQPIKEQLLFNLTDKKSLLSKIVETNNGWKITLFTSGTTGVPKKISHNFKSISRFVKVSPKNNDSTWGFAYNPTHMAGIQVFFQALLNTNSIVRLFGLSNQTIYQEIEDNNITHISATPTFYRLLLPCSLIFSSVTRITSGGEKFNENTFSQLKEVFPNAKITNVYASTEAGTLFASENDLFSIKSAYKDFIKIEEDELLIHQSLMGHTYTQTDEWYKTGDIIEIVNQEPFQFRFKHRKSEMINVGGYKVNPHEVEEIIMSIPGIKNVTVYPKKNSILGNIICCDIVAIDNQIKESTIRSILQTKIQEFKIPRIIKFVDQLSTTRTGKLKRSKI